MLLSKPHIFKINKFYSAFTDFFALEKQFSAGGTNSASLLRIKRLGKHH